VIIGSPVHLVAGWNVLDDTANVDVNPLDDGIGPISASPRFVDASRVWVSTHPKVLGDTIVQSFLIIDDIDAARVELIDNGAAVSGVFHFEGGSALPGQSDARRDRIGKVSPAAPMRLAIPTATAGCYRRSRHGCPDADSARTSRR